MKRFVFLIALTLLTTLAPQAAVFSAPESACAGTAASRTCACAGGEGSNTLNEVVKGIVNITNCQQTCEAMAGGKDISSVRYQFQCVNNTGTLFIPEDGLGEITVEADLIEAEDVAKENAILPNLNVSIPGLNLEESVRVDPNTGEIKSNLLGVYVQAVYRYLIGAGALIAVVMLMIGGLEYVISAGSAKRVEKARSRIRNAIAGVILLLLAYNLAFLIDPRTVTFESLSVKHLEGIDDIPPEGEDTNVAPNATLNGETVSVEGDHLVIVTQNPTLDEEATEALKAAAASFNERTEGGNIVITSATRDLKKQATLFYNNCIATGGICTVPTCNPASSSVVKRSGGKYELAGELTGVQDPTTIINGIAKYASYGNCPHTSAVAVDAWCEGSGNYQADPRCQEVLIQSMIDAGFCRLKSEAWHFELNTKKVSSSCSTTNSNISYTSRSGTYTPPSSCQRWDFKNHKCVTQRVE